MSKKSRLPKNKKSSLKQRRSTMDTRDDLNVKSEPAKNNEKNFSIIRNREELNDGYHSTGPPGMSGYVESSDDYYGVASDSDLFKNERYMNDDKLRKRCAVVITPTKELIQYERKRDQMYNEILQKQRRKLELRALEKQREKERRRLGRREEKKDPTERDRDKKILRKARNYNEVLQSSESETESNFHLRTHRQRLQGVKELLPLNIQIEMTEATTNSLLNQIDAHLDKPETKKTNDDNTIKLNTEEEPANYDDYDINQQTCDISSDKGQTKMRELNLLADIAQHLSPYQLDLPENNISNGSSPPKTPTPETATETAQHVSQQAIIAPKEKVTVTEHLIIQSFDNLLEKPQIQLDINEQQQATTPIYAHEPKLNTAAILNSSPSANLLQTQNQNTPTSKTNINTESIKSLDNLEQILEESISVLKSVTSPFNPANEPPEIQHTETSIPLLISNVESLNNFEQSAERQKCDDKGEHSENLVLENRTENTKDVTEDSAENVNRIETEASILSSTILNPVESTLLASGDLSNISSETEISQALKVSNLMSADLSDISFESEISKHLPEIAEPSPVVTDMSDNSNESQFSKNNFSLQNSNNTPHAAEVSDVVLPLPVLPLEMPNIPQQPRVQQESMEIDFNNLNSTLNTPTKLAVIQPTEVGSASSSQPSNDLNTPLKFGLQTELENEKEPEADNNVTKFLDLILNKTVTDAESETRDKIIKELNALTADTTGGSSETSEIDNNEEIPTATETELSDNIMNETSHGMEAVSKAKTQNIEETREESETLKTLENSSDKSKTNNDYEAENNEFASNAKHEDVIQSNGSTETNNELNPPEEIFKEQESPTELLKNDVTTIEPTKPKSSAIKQTFNIKCRVRLKRVNIEGHCKTHKKETWVAIPITKNEETLKNNESYTDMTNCDTMMDTTTSLIIKPCLKYNNNISSSSNKRLSDEMEFKNAEEGSSENPKNLVVETKRAKLEEEPRTEVESSPIIATTSKQQLETQTPSAAPVLATFNTTTPPKSKSKSLKTVTFDLSNLNEELRDTTSFNHRSKSRNHAASIAAGAMGCYLKNSRSPRKLPDNTLRAAETLQLFVNTINDSTRTPPSAEFNKKRSPIKNKCIAEDETPRPPPASTLMGTPHCKKSCTEKVRSQITSRKCKDQLVSSLTTPSISSITSDITTARIYTSSPLDQTLPEYDDNVDTVADTELILPTTTGSLRRKLKRPKKSLTRPEPADDINADDISNQPECNGEDDTDAVVDNEDDVFVEELLPIPAANEHILEEIVSARPSHIGTGTVIRDDYMNIEATATVPVYLFNDESRDLATPEPIQSSDTTNVVDSSSYLNNSSSTSHIGLQTNTASTTTSSASASGNLEKSMLSPSEHEVSSTQETFYQTPTKSKQCGEVFAEKSGINKDKSAGGGGGSNSSNNSSLKQKNEDNLFKNKEDDQTSSTTGLLQNNQVDTTNHSPEMCTLTLTTPTTTTSNSNMTSNRKIRKASTHDEILFNELQLQQQQQVTNKRKNLTTTTTTFCAESTSDNNSKSKLVTNNLEDIKTNGSLAKEDKLKKILKKACKKDKNTKSTELEVGVMAVGGGGGGGGSSPSTTTTINEEKLPRSKRKKQKSSKSSKSKNHSERSTKIVLKASKLAAHIPATNITIAAAAAASASVNPLIITIPKSRLLRPPPTPTPSTPTDSQEELEQQNEFLDIPNAKLFIEKEKETTATTLQHNNHHQHHHHNHATGYSIKKKEPHQTPVAVTGKSKRSHSPTNTTSQIPKLKSSDIVDSESQDVPRNTNSTTTTTITPKDRSSSTLTSKKKIKTNSNSSSNTTSNYNSTTAAASCTKSKNNSNNNLIFVKDKYDLIKSKDKYQNQHDSQDSKEKLKDNTSSSQSKTTTSSTSARLHKSSSKEKIKEKHKSTEKSATQAENVLKLNITQSSNKGLTLNSTSSSTSTSSASNTRQSTSKSNRNSSNSSSTSSASLSASSAATTAILKSKTNLSTQSLAAAASAASTHLNNATSNSASASSSPSVTISTNHVRKKLKTK